MILLLELTLFGVLLSLAYGWLLEFGTARLFKFSDDQTNHFSISILLGVSILSGLLGIWSFFSKIDTFTVRIFTIGVIVLLILTWKYTFTRLKTTIQQLRATGFLSWLFLFAFLVYALYLASASDITYDTGLYHAQSIRWIESYPAVKGIANIHDRLGFNSNLFLLSAFWGWADQGEHAYQIPGLVVSVAFAFFCLYLIKKSFKQFNLSGVVAAGFLVYLLAEKGIIVWFASPTADLSAALLSWIIFLLAAEKIENRTSSEFDFQTLAIIILSFFDITLKLSTVPILLVSGYFIWSGVGNLSLPKLASLLAPILLVALPWMVRNVFITGYVIYPFYQLDIFNVDWKVPHETAIHTSQVVIAWGRFPYEKYSLVMQLKFHEWLPVWYQTLPPADCFLITSILVLSLSLGVAVWLNGQIRDAVEPYSLIYLFLALDCAFWFVQSPSPRFGYSFLVTLFWFLIAPFVLSLLQKRSFSSNGFMLLIQIFLIGYTAYSMTRFSVNSWKHYLHAYKSFPIAETFSVNVGSMVLFIPNTNEQPAPNNDAQCWYEAFPCAPSLVPKLSMRGTKIEDGFYIKRNND